MLDSFDSPWALLLVFAIAGAPMCALPRGQQRFVSKALDTILEQTSL